VSPLSQAFHDVFGLGDDEEKISTVDADGVALAAIQGLAERQDDAAEAREATAERVDELEAENEALRQRLAALEERVESADASAD